MKKENVGAQIVHVYVAVKIAEIVGNMIMEAEKQDKLDCKVCRNFRNFWKLPTVTSKVVSK